MSKGKPATPVKGQLALKSSPLNPTNGKLMSHQLVADHMNAHYRKLLNAKAAIDSKVPKAYTSSQKVRDRETRKLIASGKQPKLIQTNRPSRPSSARSTGLYQSANIDSRPYSARNRSQNNYYEQPFSLDEGDYENLTQDQIDFINAMVNDTIDSDRFDRVLNGRTSVRSNGSGSAGMRTSRGVAEGMKMDTTTRKKTSADILDKRDHVFSNAKEFTPRTNRNPKYGHVPSKLTQTKHYRALKSKSPPTARRFANKAEDAPNDGEILDETIVSRDFNSRLEMSGTVPRLDISIDQDHLKWLQEQSARQDSKYRPLEHELKLPKSSRKDIEARKSYTQQKIQQEEEELAYIDFITEVTNDVLTRGIFTNRVLNKVFDEHVEKNKHRLSEGRMRGMLDSLRSDLGITADDDFSYDNIDDVGMGPFRPAVRSKTKTSGYEGVPSQFRTIKLDTSSSGTSTLPKPTKPLVDDSLDSRFGTMSLKPDDDIVNEYSNTLADIKEDSEKSSSTRRSRRSSNHEHVGQPPEVNQYIHKKQNDDLLDILGLDDVDSKVSTANEQTLNLEDKKMAAIDTYSIRSGLSSHASEKRSSKPPSDVEKSSNKEDNASVKSLSSKSQTSVKKLGSASVKKQGSEESEGSDGSTHTLTRGKEEEKDDLESNADFGKTTVFAKTRDMNLTYKALSQASDEEDEDGGAGDANQYNYSDDDDF